MILISAEKDSLSTNDDDARFPAQPEYKTLERVKLSKKNTHVACCTRELDFYFNNSNFYAFFMSWLRVFKHSGSVGSAGLKRTS